MDNLDHNKEMEVDDKLEEGTENNEVETNTENDILHIPVTPIGMKPQVGQEFLLLEDAYNFYNAYAKVGGFSVRKSSEKKRSGGGEIIRKEYVCSKEGKSNIIEDVDALRHRGVARECCKARIALALTKKDTYVVAIFSEVHSHPLSTPSRVHRLRSHRGVSVAQRCLSEQLNEVNIPTHQQYDILTVQSGGYEHVGCTEKDLHNLNRDKREETKGRDGQLFFEYLNMEKEKNSSFYYKIETDEEKKITHCFWADATSRREYATFGDVVIFDTTYNTNRYGFILAPLVGVNNHGHTIVFGCGLLSDETAPSFVWLFKQFLEAMPGDAPKMIITDQDPAMTLAIPQVFPGTFHRYCSWHILNKFSSKLDVVKYNKYYIEFQSCIWNSRTKDQFESTWLELVNKSGLNSNGWLTSMYDIRSRWVPVFMNDIFSAEMSSSQRAESNHAFFKRFVDKENSLLDFIVRWFRAVQTQRRVVLDADDLDLRERPKMRMYNAILEQMASVYTRWMFYQFQDEFLGGFDYKFHKVSNDDGVCVYKTQRKGREKTDIGRQVFYDEVQDFVTCSCKKFESLGILCRHILGFLHKSPDFDLLPDQYILKRWTKSEKSSTVLDNMGVEIVGDKSYMKERSRLVQCCLSVVDKALRSPEATQVLINAMKNAENEIDFLIGATSSGKKNDENVHYDTSTKITGTIPSDDAPVYREPSRVSFKGCGTRMKGGKEIALARGGKSKKPRLCKGCNEYVFGHNVRSCPGKHKDGSSTPASDNVVSLSSP